MKRKLLSLLLTLVLVLSLLPHTAWAEVYEHYFGEQGTSFVYDTDTKTLTISGYGPIPSKSSDESIFSIFGFSVAEVEKVVIKSGVTIIGQNAFCGFTSLTSVSIPATVTAIYGSAFYDCRSLRSVTLPKNLKTIEGYAFANCTSLTSITIPASVTYIGYNAFYECEGVKVTFLGDAPRTQVERGNSLPSSATVYYPAGNPTWTDMALSMLGGNTRVPVCSGSHSLGEWTTVDENKHQSGCIYCDYEETADHTWDGGTTTLAPTCQATGEALFTCTGCGETKTEVLPIGDHPYSPWEKVDDQTHTHTCTVCSKEETVDHSWDEGTTVKAANCIADGEMKYTCTGCGLTRSEVVPMNGIHTYDHGCDKDCNICGATRTTSHKYSSDWTGNKSGHWHKCVHCGDKQAAVAHVPGPEATEETPQTCTACGYILKPTLKHEHDFAAALTGDETGHWFPCATCTEQKDFAAHDFTNDCDTKCDACGFERITQHVWSEAWSHDEAGHFYTCTVCGEKKADSRSEHDFRRGVCKVCAAADPNYEPAPVGLIAAAAVVVCGGAAAIVAVGKKKKKNAA